nr:hypothetical protein [uncultured Flavobacterium sp.]
MVKKLRFILLFLFLLTEVYSQGKISNSATFEVSNPYKVVDGYSKTYFIQDNEIMSVKLGPKDVYVQKYKADKPEFVSEKKYEKYFHKDFSFECVRELNKRFYIFYNLPHGDKEQLFAQEVDFGKGEFTGDPKLLIVVDSELSFRYVDRDAQNDYAKFQVLPSLDKKTFLVKYRKFPAVKNDKKNHDIIGLHSFDGNLERTANREFVMPYTERRMNIMDFQIDNKGNIYMLSKIYNDDSENDITDNIVNSRIELFTIKKDSDKIDITVLENKNKVITNLSLFDLPQGGAIAGGYYNNGTGELMARNSDGIILFKITEEGKIYDPSAYEIPLEVVNEFVAEKEQTENLKKQQKGEGKIIDLRLTDLDLRKDGSILVIGEQQYQIRTTSGGANSHTSTGYFYDNVIVAKIKSDGTLGWMKKIPKRQRGTFGQGGMSYKYFHNQQDNYFLFLDNIKNIDLPLNKTPSLHSDKHGGYLTSVKISDANGEMTKNTILNFADTEDFDLHQFETDRAVKTSDTSFVFEAYKKKKEDVMIKVTLH